ncbi:something about silencing protein 10 [Entomophthora muscae]|uniref:Something about silencing protein 10 n=1 Tax=Entomophthora muscae TaxID=34485 RepID=A0ACC2RP98_9FUNG|nr:something about silencing protein 10 [Entomophthora muscae]
MSRTVTMVLKAAKIVKRNQALKLMVFIIHGFLFNIKRWGDRAGNYYDGDEAEEEDDAKQEEEEARRLQKKHALSMTEEDFLDQLPGQLSGKGIVKDTLEDKKLVEDLDAQLKMIDIDQTIEIVPKSKKTLSHKEALEILTSESPEILDLLEQLKDRWDYLLEKMPSVTDRIQALKPEVVRSTPILKHLYLKYETLLNYMTNIAFYLHLKACGTKDIQTHPVVEALVKYTNVLHKLEDAEENTDDIFEMVDEVLTRIENGGTAFSSEDDSDNQDENTKELPDISVQGSESEASDMESLVDEDSAESVSEVESEDKFTTLEQLRRNLRKPKASAISKKESDFMDSEFLDEDDAAEKMIKKRTLRHHASVINQGIFKRQMQPKFSGDADIPYKNADAQRNKVPASQAINRESNDADVFDDEDYVSQKEEPKKKRVKTLDPEEMARRHENWAALNPDEQEVDGNRKRLATYKILKNKGLAPKRKKEQRNPRVKHRKKFEKASKKLSSFKRVVQKPTASYGGETTGIKTHLSRSVRFQ